MAEGVEIRGPPDRVPYLQIFVPIVGVDWAGVGGVPGLVETGVIGIRGVGEDSRFFFNGVAEDSRRETVENAEGAGGGCCDVGIVNDVKGWAGGWSWIPKAGIVGGSRTRRFRGDHGGG